VLADLAALTPPLLVAVAFLIAAGAFVRHEMRRGKNAAEDEQADSSRDSSQSSTENESGRSSVQRSFRDNPQGHGPEAGN
jgi:hypothetical protein